MKLENCYCLSINPTRYNYTCSVFEKYGLTIPHMFTGIKSKETPERCCLFGHMSIIMMARYCNLPYVCIFEDDAYPRKDALNLIDYYTDNIPSDCGVLVLGTNGYAGKVDHFKDYYIVWERPFGAHAYIVYNNCYDDILNSMQRIRVADIALRGYEFKNKKPYWTNDCIFIQKNNTSECMSKKLVEKYGKYFYPNPNTHGLGVYNELPNKYFE